MEQTYQYFVGIDLASEEHEACTLVPSKDVVDRRPIRQSGDGIDEYVTWLAKLSAGKPDSVAIAVEAPRGALVDALIERGFEIYVLNPKQLDRFRDRHSPAGAKDDRLDSFVLGSSLITDGHLYRRVRIDSPHVLALREISRADEEAVEELGRTSSRLREQLNRYFAQALALCPAANEQWLWSLLELAPTPKAAAKLTFARIAKLLKQHRIRKLTAKQVQEALRAAPLPVAPGVAEAAAEHVMMLVPRLRLAHEQRQQCTKRLEQLLDAMADEEGAADAVNHGDVEIIRSLPGAGRRFTATMIVEASRTLVGRDYGALRALAGTAPVTQRTGKQGKRGTGRPVTVVMRRACNKRLRTAVYHMSRVAMITDPTCRAQYSVLRKRGHTHGRALRSMGDRLLNVLVAMLKSRTLYRPRIPDALPLPEPQR